MVVVKAVRPCKVRHKIVIIITSSFNILIIIGSSAVVLVAIAV